MSVCHFSPIILVNFVFWQGQGVPHSAFAPTVIVLGGTLPACSWVVLDSAASLRLSALFCSSCNKKKVTKTLQKSTLVCHDLPRYLASVVALVSPVGLPSTARSVKSVNHLLSSASSIIMYLLFSHLLCLRDTRENRNIAFVLLLSLLFVLRLKWPSKFASNDLLKHSSVPFSEIKSVLC